MSCPKQDPSSCEVKKEKQFFIKCELLCSNSELLLEPIDIVNLPFVLYAKLKKLSTSI